VKISPINALATSYTLAKARNLRIIASFLLDLTDCGAQPITIIEDYRKAGALQNFLASDGVFGEFDATGHHRAIAETNHKTGTMDLLSIPTCGKEDSRQNE